MSLLKALTPGTMTCLVVVIAGGVAAMARGGRTGRWARVWLAGWTLFYMALSLPVASRLLLSGLSGSSRPIASIDQARGADAVVVFAGDCYRFRLGSEDVFVMAARTAVRVLEAARVYHLLGSPAVIVSGARDPGAGERDTVVQAMRAGLIAADVPADRILFETSSTDTRHSGVALRELLRAHGLTRVVVVSSEDHMRRALLSVRATGLDAVPSPAPVQTANRPGIRHLLTPDLSALSVSSLCLHEYFGLAYYVLRDAI